MHKYMIYMAAGNSRRFGGNKLLYMLDGKPMYQYGLHMLSGICKGRKDCSVTVVSRYAPILREARELGFGAIDSPKSELGVAYTIRAGIEALGEVPEGAYLLFLVADQPYLTAASVERLLDAAEEGPEGACLCYGDRPGNPALFSARRIPELLCLEGDTGGRSVLRRYPCLYVPADEERELEDVDTR